MKPSQKQEDDYVYKKLDLPRADEEEEEEEEAVAADDGDKAAEATEGAVAAGEEVKRRAGIVL